MFHSGHLSHLLKLSCQPYRCQKILTAVRKSSPPATFPATFFGEVLFQHRPYHPVRKEGIFKFCQSTRRRFSATRVSSPTREGAWRIFWPRLTPSSHPPFVLVPSEPCKCIFLGFFVSTGPLNSLSDDLRWLPLHPEPCTCLRKCSSTLLVVPHLFFFTIWSLTATDPRFFFFQPRSKAVLGLSSIQTYFVLQISKYDY